MFLTLVYIPTILAYIFITLLLVILGFIIIYVAHKIYTILYDNIPVAQIASKSTFMLTGSNDSLTMLSKTNSRMSRKSKTALRIIVALEPCYLAYMMFEAKLLSSKGSLPQPNQNPNRSSSSSITVNDSRASIQFIIKYYDNLTSIPCSTDLECWTDLNFDYLNSRK